MVWGIIEESNYHILNETKIFFGDSLLREVTLVLCTLPVGKRRDKNSFTPHTYVWENVFVSYYAV